MTIGIQQEQTEGTEMRMVCSSVALVSSCSKMKFMKTKPTVLALEI